MTFLLHLALLVAAIPATGAAGAPATASQIEKLTQDGNADEAIQKGRAAVDVHGDDVDLRLALARALAAKARKANRVIDATLSKNDIARGQATLSGVDLSSAKLKVDYDPALFDEAMLHLDHAVAKAPARVDVRVFQCFLLTDAGKIARAQSAIKSALAALPKTPETAKTMTAYGAERVKRGDAEGGAALLAPVAEAFPTDPAILTDYANALTRTGRKAEAFAAFDKATQLAPKDIRYARTRAVGAMLLRDFKRAQSAYDATFRLGHGVADEFASYAAAYGVDPAGASILMRELGTSSPSSDPAVVDLANAFSRAGKAGAGTEEAMMLARRLVTAEQYVLAIPVLDRAIKANPANAEAKTMLQTTFRKLGCELLAK